MASLPYGYWTYGTRNGLEGAESTLKELPNGQVVRLKDPDHPCVLEDEFILFAVRNDLNARRQFFTLLPTMDAVSQERLNGLVGRYPSAFNVTLDSTTLSDNIQMNGVVPTRPDTCRNRYLEVPKPNCVSRTNTKPEAYSSGPVEVLEGASVSISIPTSIKYTTTVTGLPRGLRWNGSRITGTAPLVTEDESYTITVLRSNSIGSTPGVFVLTIKDVRPAAPTIDSVTPGNQQAVVAITPGDDGGSPIIDYQYSTNGGVTWISIGSTVSPLTIAPLDNGVDYTLLLRPVNANGPGDSSDPFVVTPAAVPDKPTIDSVTEGDQEVTVAVSGGDGGSPITDYEYTVDGGLNWISTGDPTSPITIAPLVNGTDYIIQVRPVNDQGTGVPSDPFTATPSTVPDAPVITGAVEGDEQVTVSFTVEDQGSAITDIEYTLDGINWISSGSTTSPVVISGLTNGVTYPLQLRGVNDNGTGAASGVTNVTPSTVPAQPTIDSITEGDQQLTVAFTPGDDGGSAITDYEYTLDGINWLSAGTTVSPFTIGGLTNGTTYPIQIRPINANGTGTPSTVTNATPSTVPDAPTLDSLTVGDQQLTVNFTSGDDGGSAITDIEYRLDGGAWVSAGTAASPFVISGLTNGVEYDVEIKAVNANGDSAVSNLLSATPVTTPAAPTIDSLTSGDEQLTVNFTAGDDGGSAITDYEYSLDGGAFVSAGTTTSPFTITGLTNGTSYDVVIRAVSAEGNGASSVADTGTPSTVPDAPTLVSLTPGDQQLSVDFTLNGDGGSAITDVEYQINGIGPWVSAGTTTSPFVIGSLINGVNYTITVRAVNANGSSAASNSLSSIPQVPATAPDAPTLNSVTSGDQQLTAAFTLGGDGGSAITDVEYRLDGGAWVSFGATTSPQVISGLTNGTEYDVEIRAVNAVGSSPASNLIAGTPSTVPDAPTLDSLTSGSTELEAAFTLNGTGGSAITDVEYRLNSGAWVSFGATTSPQMITGLTNGVAYTVEVRAVNANGASPASNSLTETPAASWEPTDVNVVAWVDASDTSSYTTSGSTLTAVTDKAGTYTLGITGTPTRVTGGLNSLNVFDFDGSNEYIQSTAYRTQVSSGNHWAIGVFRPDVADGTKDSLWSYETGNSPKRDYAVSAGSTGSWPGELDLDALSSNRISSTIGNKQDWNLQSLTLGSWAIVVTYFNKTGNQIGCRKNGNNCFTPVNDYDNNLQSNQELRLMRNRASEELNGRLAEFFAVADLPGTGGTDLSDVEKAEGYLAWKWGLESLLPSGHPYKNSPP